MLLVCGGNRCVVEQDGRQAPLSAGRIRHLRRTGPYEVACGSAETGPPADADLHVLAFPAAAVPEPGRAAGGRAYPGRRGPGGS